MATHGGAADGSHGGAADGTHRDGVDGAHRGGVDGAHRGGVDGSHGGGVDGSHGGGVDGSHGGTADGSHGGAAPALPGPVLQVAGISCRFGDRVILDRVSVEVRSGEAVAVLGPNGAGKSTFLRSVVGTIGRGGGAVTLGGKPLRDTEPAVRAAIATVGDDTDFFDDLSVAEHLNLVAAAHGVPEPNDAAGQVAIDVGLLDAWEQLPGTLSQGQRRRLAIGLALVRPRQLLILDEPEQRLDTAGREWLAGRLQQEKADGVAVLFASHDPQLVNAVADRRLVLGTGTDLAAAADSATHPAPAGDSAISPAAAGDTASDPAAAADPTATGNPAVAGYTAAGTGSESAAEAPE